MIFTRYKISLILLFCLVFLTFAITFFVPFFASAETSVVPFSTFLHSSGLFVNGLYSDFNVFNNLSFALNSATLGCSSGLFSIYDYTYADPNTGGEYEYEAFLLTYENNSFFGNSFNLFINYDEGQLKNSVSVSFGGKKADVFFQLGSSIPTGYNIFVGSILVRDQFPALSYELNFASSSDAGSIFTCRFDVDFISLVNLPGFTDYRISTNSSDMIYSNVGWAYDRLVYAYSVLDSNSKNNEILVNNAFNSGYLQGVTDSSNKVDTGSASYEAGLSAGKDIANQTVNNNSASYVAGYQKGIDSAGKYTFTSLIAAVIDVPVNAFMSLFNFDILGVNMASFFLALLTLALVVLVLKLVFSFI